MRAGMIEEKRRSRWTAAILSHSINTSSSGVPILLDRTVTEQRGFPAVFMWIMGHF